MMNKNTLILILIAKCIIAQGQLTFTELVENAEKTVISITTYDINGNPLLTGTGFFIESRGTVLSNLHIFENAYSATISTYNNDIFDLDTILLSSKEYDIIKFMIHNPKGIKFNYLAFKTQIPQKGEDIFTIGSPLGLESTVSKGIISNIREIDDTGSLYQITAPISAGSSGSPVINMKGEVVGIVTFLLTSGQNLNFAIDVDIINRITQNDAIFSTINAKKALPPNQEIAWQTIDSMWLDNELLPYLNEYIHQYPNDHRGYLKRAQLFSDEYGAHFLMEDKYKMRIDDPKTHVNIVNLGEDGDPVTHDMYQIGQSRVYQRSIPDFDKALILKPNEPQIYYQRGLAKLFYCQSNPNKIPGWTFQTAIEDLLKSNGLISPKDQQDRYYFLGIAYTELSQYRNALNSFNQALKVKNVPYDSYYNPHIIYYEIAKIKCDNIGDTTGAIIDLDRAIELTKTISTFQGEDRAPSSYLAKRADIYYAQKEYSKALKDLMQLNKSIYLSSEGRSSYTHYLECFLILKLDGDLKTALESISIAIKWDDHVDFFYKTRASVYNRLKDYANALKDSNKAFELNPNGFNDFDYSERSRIKGLLNDNVGAIKDIDEALKRNTKESYYYNLKAIYLGQLGDDIGAEKQYDKAIELDPKNADYYISRGWSRLRNKKTDACADWSKAGELGNYKAYDLIQKYCK